VLLTLLALLAVQDPEAILKEARSAQASFERTRRFHLPRSHAEARHRCDEQIGGLCYWYDPGESPPPPEGAAIAAARSALLVELAAAAERLPGNPWILGQQVWYLIEASRLDEARDLAGRCAAARGWCSALAGLVLHRAGAIPSADSAFSRALGLVEPEARCGWLDIRLLLSGSAARQWRSLSCAEQVVAAEGWLERGRPLLALAGNSVRTEFLSRQAIVRIVEGTLTPYGTRLDDAHREFVLRYGWSTGWSQGQAWAGGRDGSVRGHDPFPAWGLTPANLTGDEFDINHDRPRARFPVPGLAALLTLEDVQLARFPRPGGTLLVAAWQLPPANPLNTAGVTGVLAGKTLRQAPEVAGQIPDGRGGVASAVATGALVSGGLELLTADGATWARHREEWADPLPTSGPVLSDLLLYQAGESNPELLDEVLPRAIRGTAVRRGGAIGLYWEWARLPPGTEAVSTRIQLRPGRGGAATLAWSWPAQNPMPRSGSGSMGLDLGRLGRGEYILEVVLTVGARELRSQRALRVN